MHLVAKVFDWDITEEEIASESAHLVGQDSDLAQVHALNRLIDRFLLLHQAQSKGINASDEEYDSALLETLEDIEAVPSNDEETRELEERIRRRIIIRKYVQQICALDVPIGDEQLLAFYEEQKEVFFAPEAVRAAHILIRADQPEAEKLARELRDRIQTEEDFQNICGAHSQCPTGVRCGDLGWFPRGRMIKELEDAAFGLEVGEISDIIHSRYGFHILMVTDKKVQRTVAFEEIRDSLKSRLLQLEREFYLIRHVNGLRKSYQNQIRILDSRYVN